MSTDIVLYDSRDNVATITLNRPDKLNALSNAMVAELRDALIHFEAGEDRVAVLTGAGERAFTAGADLRDPPRSPELWECMPGVGVPLTKPTIAAVAGHCVGGGCCLVEFCTLAVARRQRGFLLSRGATGILRRPHRRPRGANPVQGRDGADADWRAHEGRARLRGRDGQRGRPAEAADGGRLRVRPQTGRKRAAGAGTCSKRSRATCSCRAAHRRCRRIARRHLLRVALSERREGRAGGRSSKSASRALRGASQKLKDRWSKPARCSTAIGMSIV